MPSHAERWLASAIVYVERYGLSVLPMGRNKRPLMKWIDLQSRRLTARELLEFGPKENLAIITGSISNLVVVDCESAEDAQWFWRERGQSEVVVKTKRGYHMYFQHPGERVANAQKVDGRYDVRGDGGYVLAPPSVHSEGAYTWTKPLIPTDSLSVFQMAWRPPTVAQDSTQQISDGVAYISTIRAVAGQRGHDNTYRAACSLRDSGLSEGESLLALQQWNRTNADPPWSDNELLHKIRSAFAANLTKSLPLV